MFWYDYLICYTLSCIAAFGVAKLVDNNGFNVFRESSIMSSNKISPGLVVCGVIFWPFFWFFVGLYWLLETSAKMVERLVNKLFVKER